LALIQQNNMHYTFFPTYSTQKNLKTNHCTAA